jgi:hypothetical protein
MAVALGAPSGKARPHAGLHAGLSFCLWRLDVCQRIESAGAISISIRSFRSQKNVSILLPQHTQNYRCAGRLRGGSTRATSTVMSSILPPPAPKA